MAILVILAILSLLVAVASLSFTVGKTLWDKWKQRCSDAGKGKDNFKTLNSEFTALLHLATDMDNKADELGATSDHEYNFWRNTRISEICQEAGNLVSQYKLEENLSKKKLAKLSKKMEDCANRVRRLRKDAETFLSRFDKKYRKRISRRSLKPRKGK